jgi:hypothetical protein
MSQQEILSPAVGAKPLRLFLALPGGIPQFLIQ